ncbi:MAG: DNA replication and repair protein RecF [Coriobacteriales bacterium]
MTLKIKSVILDNFRGYDRLSLDDLGNLVIVVGPNAVGKTNIVEAIQLLTAGSSFRKPSWTEVISWGQERGHALIRLEEDKRRIEQRIVLAGNERTYEVNGKRKSPSSIRGVLPCVLFTPDDLQLIKASSTRRRDAIDALAVQLSKNYSSLKSEYQQALKQRNLLIKEGIHEGALFESWDESLAIHGARLCLARWRLFDRLLSHMTSIYGDIVPGEQLDARYIPSWDRLDSDGRQRGDVPSLEQEAPQNEDVIPSSSEMTLEEIQDRLIGKSRELASVELRRGVSLIGPHKDEIAFFINGRNARLFASQGQQRTIVLVMKLASVELVNEIVGTEPVLLLDDVMSELDEKHRDALTAFIEKNAQTFITTTNLDYFSAETINRATVVRVPIEGTRYDYSCPI